MRGNDDVTSGARLYGAYKPASPNVLWFIPVSSANSLVHVPPPHPCTVGGPVPRVRPSASNMRRVHSGIVQRFIMRGSNVLSSRIATMSGCSCGEANAMSLPHAGVLHVGGLSVALCIQESRVSSPSTNGGMWISVWENDV